MEGSCYRAHKNGRADRCREAYEYARSQRWPVGYRNFRPCFRLESAESLEGLVPPVIGKRGVRLSMGMFKLGAKKAIKLFDLVKPDGHHPILQLAVEYQDQVAKIERKVGVSFVM